MKQGLEDPGTSAGQTNRHGSQKEHVTSACSTSDAGQRRGRGLYAYLAHSVVPPNVLLPLQVGQLQSSPQLQTLPQLHPVPQHLEFTMVTCRATTALKTADNCLEMR